MASGIEGLIYQYLQIENKKTGKKIDLSNSVIATDYYENILQPCITMTLYITTTRNVVSELPIRGGEFVACKFSTPSGTFKRGDLDSSGDIVEESDEMIVYKVSNLDTEREAAFFTLHLISREYLIDRAVRCKGKFKYLTIDNHVRYILKDIMKTKKNCDIDLVNNPYSFMGNSNKPFHTIQWLCPKSISSSRSGSEGEDGTLNGKAYGVAGYLFFENKNGFNFKSIEGLVAETKKSEGSADTKDTIHGTYSWTGLGGFESGDFRNNVRIINYYMEKNIDLRNALTVGTYVSDIQSLNIETQKLSSFRYDLSEELTEKLGGEGVLDIPFDASTRTIVKTTGHGFMGVGENGLEDTGRDKTDDAKATARYNLLFTQALNIEVPCNVNLKVGDIIKCDFPQLKDGRADEVDRSASGKYLIQELRHHFQIGKNITSLKLIRDSYGFSNSQSPIEKLIERDEYQYGNTVPAGSFSITPKPKKGNRRGSGVN